MGKDASNIADKYNLLADEQYGKLHGNTIHLATTKRLVYNILMQMKLPLAVSFQDARSCYDLLTLHRLGIHKAVIISMLHTIQKMEHSI